MNRCPTTLNQKKIEDMQKEKRRISIKKSNLNMGDQKNILKKSPLTLYKQREANGEERRNNFTPKLACILHTKSMAPMRILRHMKEMYQERGIYILTLFCHVILIHIILHYRNISCTYISNSINITILCVVFSFIWGINPYDEEWIHII